jgi:hypothetical protein
VENQVEVEEVEETENDEKESFQEIILTIGPTSSSQ